MKLTIVDDNTRLAREVQHSLEGYDDFQNIAVFSSGLDYAHELLEHPEQVPDCILMDISMRIQDEGIHATRIIHERYPQVKIVMFTISDEDDRVFEAFKAGAVGYLLKNEKPAFIYQTLVDVFNGGALMSPSIALKTIRFLSALSPVTSVTTSIPEDVSTLTEREVEVLRLISKGLTYQAIADQLFISVQTIKKHMSNIFKKLQVSNKIEAVNKSKQVL